MAKGYYETLGVSKSADDADIKSAYRKLAKQYHPDRNKGNKDAEAKFKEINEAYETLKDPQKKAAYDRYGHDMYKNAASSGGFSNAGGFSSSGFGGFGHGHGDYNESTFSDIFDTLFGGSGAHRHERTEMRGSDLQYESVITLEEAFNGKDIELKIKTGVKCDHCNGTGSDGGTKAKTCPSCRGAGKVRFQQGFFTVEKTCNSCNGTGDIIENVCKLCNGSGRSSKIKTMKISIPAGIEDGARIRLSGEGEAGIRGGKPGDLYIFASVKTHKLFRREGNSIHCDVPISMVTAALGGEIEVPTIDGKKVLVKVAAGTQAGNILKVKNKGMSMLRSSFRGDMLIHARVETPVNLTKKQKELLEAFDKEHKVHPQSDGFFTKVKEFWQEL